MLSPALGLSQVARKRAIASRKFIQASSRSRLGFLLLDSGLSRFIIALRYLDESITARRFESGFSNRG
jgi:hypothetical protein